ncbi:MAG: sigma-70 family RNA polymerase sigma factor [Acidobacteria bacterium]|nr:sigma-70 family RNA polymerase sigma factor [Acidobacteriota bacterium]
MTDSSTSPPHQITRILKAISAGDPDKADQLYSLVYDELRQMARVKMARERPGQTLQPTALVHEAYLRLLGGEEPQWESRAHFFTAAAEAMRRILIDRARRYARAKHGGGRQRVELESSAGAQQPQSETLLALDEVLDRLEERDAQMAQVVKLRYFAGLTAKETAEAMGISERSVYRSSTLAKAWLHREMSSQ